MKTSETLKLIANGLAHEKNGKAKVQSAGRELLRIAGQVEELERNAMLSFLPESETEADALDGVGDFAREGQGGAEDAVADQVERMARANPDIARIVQAHTADGRVDYTAALLDLVQVLDRQNDALARQIAEVAEAEADLTTVYMAGAERGRDAVVALRDRVAELAERFGDRSLVYDAKAEAVGEGETVSARSAWLVMADLAFEVSEALSRLLVSPQDAAIAAGEGARGDFPGAGGIKGRVSGKSPEIGLSGGSRGMSKNRPVVMVCGTGPETAVEGQEGGEHG